MRWMLEAKERALHMTRSPGRPHANRRGPPLRPKPRIPLPHDGQPIATLAPTRFDRSDEQHLIGLGRFTYKERLGARRPTPPKPLGQEHHLGVQVRGRLGDRDRALVTCLRRRPQRAFQRVSRDRPNLNRDPARRDRRPPSKTKRHSATHSGQLRAPGANAPSVTKPNPTRPSPGKAATPATQGLHQLRSPSGGTIKIKPSATPRAKREPALP